jgi:iron complex transport system substrate-binding protein
VKHSTALRRFAGAAAIALALPAIAACSTGSTTTASADAHSQADADAFPVTIEHALGETTIENEPTRVATIGWSDQDHVLALGVAPVGATRLTWGGNENGSSDWFDAALADLDADQPTRYSDTDGVPVDEIAALAPDLILATQSGIDQQDYRRLSKIAPVVAYPDAPWSTSWRESLELIGTALGRSTLAEEILADSEQAIEATRAEYPQLVGATSIWGYLTSADLSTIGVYGAHDARPTFMRDLGLVDADAVDEIVDDGAFYGTISAERADELTSDVFLTWTENAGDMETFAGHRLIGRIPALASGHYYGEDDQHVSLAITNPTPLSIPFLLERYVPEVAKAIAGQ